ncbi:hypothetical protein PAHAL_1G107700 [Panicum hallii]|jgi:hypothetical protein|uniref:Aminotransferase-like plant mobile domain-containing protein n=1 Tax=Panicum hallii TaxID=206008 RepID=A0A2T8KUW4_9POAL|nr:hypothetical protein PAHAL_1G107700 [Panicum hallii]
MESIFAFSGYRVKYSKAWRAQQHAMALLWGDWLESYGRVSQVLSGMSHFNPGIRWFTYTGNMMLPHNGVCKHVLQRVFWCSPNAPNHSSIADLLLQEYIRHLHVLNQRMEQENNMKHEQINQLLHENQENACHLNEAEVEKTKMAEHITQLEEELCQERSKNLSRRFMPPTVTGRHNYYG